MESGDRGSWGSWVCVAVSAYLGFITLTGQTFFPQLDVSSEQSVSFAQGDEPVSHQRSIRHLSGCDVRADGEAFWGRGLETCGLKAIFLCFVMCVLSSETRDPTSRDGAFSFSWRGWLWCSLCCRISFSRRCSMISRPSRAKTLC